MKSFRYTKGLHDLEQYGGRAGDPNAGTHHDDRPLRRCHARHDCLHVRLTDRWGGSGAVVVRIVRAHVREIRHGGLHIDRDIDPDGSRAPGGREMQGALDHVAGADDASEGLDEGIHA